MESNFSNNQIKKFFNSFGTNFQTRINKCGNLELVNLVNPKGKGEFYVLHAYKDGTFLWRRHYTTYWGSGSMCPLNLKNRKTGMTTVKNWRYYDYKNNCFFNSFEEAMDYIKMYFKKYRKINLY